MSSEDEEDDPKPEKLPIYRKGKEIFDIVNKIAALIPENNEYLMEVKSQMMCDAALLFVKVAGAEAQSFKKSYPLALTRASHTVAPLSHSSPASCVVRRVPFSLLTPHTFPHFHEPN